MMQIIDCEQGSEDWLRARMGIVTASEFKTIIGVKKDAREKVTRDTYMRKLAGELLTGEPMENYQNAHMERGKVQEDEARDLYALLAGIDPQRVGFIRNGNAGCSPDSLIGANGGLEIKTALAHIQIERLLRGEFPAEHRAQVQGNIWLAEREWWDFASYSPKLPLFVKRVYRDDGYIATLSGAVNAFNEELATIVASIRGWQPEKAAA
jgi:YqaJ-like viral recombinase domain